MVPWKLIERVSIPGDNGEMSLCQRGEEYSIRVDGRELMNSRIHASEETLASLACASLPSRRPRVLIGGLGMGFTLAAANRFLPADAHIEVAELVPAVIAWNRGILGALSGHPLVDKRVRLHAGDVRVVLEQARDRFDAILLDVDNGPNGLTQVANQWLYESSGLGQIRRALKPGGNLCVWSVRPDAAFTKRLGKTGFDTKVHRAAARAQGRGPSHPIWVATKPA